MINNNNSGSRKVSKSKAMAQTVSAGAFSEYSGSLRHMLEWVYQSLSLFIIAPPHLVQTLSKYSDSLMERVLIRYLH